MKKSPKLLALLLAAVMIVTMLPVMASAEEAAEPAAETVETVEAPAEAPAEETPAEAPAEEAKPDETPAEAPTEAQPEAAPADTTAIAVDTAEKTEPVVATSAEDAYWSYTSVAGETTYYMELIGDDGALTQGLLQDSGATESVGGTLKLLKDFTIGADDNAMNNTGAVVTGSAMAVIYNVNYPINIDFNGHTLTNEHAHSSGSTYFIYLTDVAGASKTKYINLYSSVPGGTYVQPATALANGRGLIGLGNSSMPLGYTAHVTLNNISVDAGNQPVVTSLFQKVYLSIKDCDLLVRGYTLSSKGAPVDGSSRVINLQYPNLNQTVASVPFVQNVILDNSSLRLGSASLAPSFYWYDYTGSTSAGYSYSTDTSRSLLIRGTVKLDAAVAYSRYANAFHGMYGYFGNGTTKRSTVDWLTWATADPGYVLSCDEGVTVDGITTWTATTSLDTNPCVSFDLGDNPASLDPQYIAEGGHPADVVVPLYELAGTVYEFSYWTAGTDEDTHYANASDYTMTDEDITLYAHYTEVTPYLSYTSVGGDTSYFFTLHDALVASQADTGATSTVGGTITLLRDISTTADGGELSDWPGTAYIYLATGKNSSNKGNDNPILYTKAITIDLNGHTLTHDKTGEHFAFIPGTNSGAPADVCFTLTSSATGGKFVNLGRSVYALGQSSASMLRNGVLVEPTVTIENITVDHQSTYSVVSSYLFGAHVIFRDATIIAPQLTGNAIASMQLAYGAINTTSGNENYGRAYVWKADDTTLGYRSGITADTPFDYTVTFEDCEIVTGNKAVFFADYFYPYTSTTYPQMTGIHLITPDNPFEPKLTFIGDNVFYYNQDSEYEPFHYCLEYGTNLNLIGSAYTFAEDPGDQIGITSSLSDQTYTYTPTGGDETTLLDLQKVTLGSGVSCEVNWFDAADELIATTTVMDGSIAIPPAYTSDLAWYEEVTGWAEDSGSTVASDLTVNGDMNFYAIVGDKYPDTRTDEPAGVIMGGSAEHYLPTLTEALTVTKGKTATVNLYADVAFNSETEPGTRSGTSYSWYVPNNGTDLTLNLNGHTLSAGTDETAINDSNKVMDRSVISYYETTPGANVSVTVNNGVLQTNGKRQPVQLGGTGFRQSSGAISFAATDVTFRLTGTTTTVIFQPQMLSDTVSPTLSFTDCFFDNQTPDYTVNYVFSPYMNANVGACPWQVSFANCTYNGFTYLTNYSKDGVDELPFVSGPQVTIDAATAAHIVDAHNGVVSTRVILDAASYDPSVETYILDPWSGGPVFSLDAVSMTLDDYLYVNVKPNDGWTADYFVTTSNTHEAVAANGETRVSNLAIAAKDMDVRTIFTIYADADATTRYLSGTYASIDSLADATSAAATGGAAAELTAAMDAMKAYGDWAAYNFGKTATAPDATAAYDVSGYDTEMDVSGASNTNTGKAGFYGTSAVLGGQLYLKHYFYQLTGLTESNAVVTDSASAVIDTVERGADSTGKFGFVKIKLAPKNFEEQYTVTVTNGTNYSVTGSFAEYAAALKTTYGTVTEKSLADALLNYCAAAKAYFTAANVE